MDYSELMVLKLWGSSLGALPHDSALFISYSFPWGESLKLQRPVPSDLDPPLRTFSCSRYGWHAVPSPPTGVESSNRSWERSSEKQIPFILLSLQKFNLVCVCANLNRNTSSSPPFLLTLKSCGPVSVSTEIQL